MGFGQLTNRQKLLILLDIRKRDPELYKYIEIIWILKKRRGLFSDGDDIHVRTNQVYGTATATTLGAEDVSCEGFEKCANDTPGVLITSIACIAVNCPI